ncbi:hypothetical protein V7124_19530 [Neobacillus niacini]|uniref:hypothetical protein n=1 Tax=Neobacillus niacini TaxID=86668 RepID=UPI002FFFB587
MILTIEYHISPKNKKRSLVLDTELSNFLVENAINEYEIIKAESMSQAKRRFLEAII